MQRLTCKPFAMLKPGRKAERLALVERVTRALVNDSDVTLSSTTTGVVVLTGGCLDIEQAACDAESGHDAYAVYARCAPDAQGEPLLHPREIVANAC